MSGNVKTLNALTGLRFLAAFAVFVQHVTPHFGFQKFHWPFGAVSFFFVLSGFILTYVYHDRLKPGGIRKFYFKRLARIWPLHIVCLVLFFALLYNRSLWSSDPSQAAKLFANFFLLQSWIPANSYGFSFNGVSWSISTELFFYLMFPLLLPGGQRRFWIKYIGLLVVTAILLIACTLISHTSMFPGVNYERLAHMNPLLRLPEFCTGMAVGFLYLDRVKARLNRAPARNAAGIFAGERSFMQDTVMEIAAVGCIVGYQYILQTTEVVSLIKQAAWGGAFIGNYVLFTCGCFLFAAVIYLFSQSDGLISRFCSSRVLVFLGEISFAFYMIHKIVIQLAISYSEFYGSLSPIEVAACIGAISIGASILLYKLVEMPCKNGLLKIYEGNWKKGLSVFRTSLWKFSQSRLCALSLLLLFVPLLTLRAYNSSTPPTPEIRQIVRATEVKFRGVGFGNSINLLGFEVVPERDGWRITMVWQKHNNFQHARFIHICDADGKVVSQGPRTEQIFQDAKIGERIVDTAFLNQKRLQNACAISVGFHDKDLGMLVADKGPRSMARRRIDLISGERFSAVVATQDQEFGERVSELRDGGSNTDVDR